MAEYKKLKGLMGKKYQKLGMSERNASESLPAQIFWLYFRPNDFASLWTFQLFEFSLLKFQPYDWGPISDLNVSLDRAF